MKKTLKLNVGASRIWHEPDWFILDHKMPENLDVGIISGTAQQINLDTNSCDIVFASHVFEHIPHLHLPRVLSEIGRVLKPKGTLRFLTPNLERITRAYVEKDFNFFELAKEEDPSIRTDLGIGGMLMNFIVSPGQDTVLVDRQIESFIAGYAHLYNYDFEMMNILLDAAGFINIVHQKFCVSDIDELTLPLRVSGFEPKWEALNPNFFKKHGLIHEMKNGVYNCNFTLCGFDRDPNTSLIVEAKKGHTIDAAEIEEKFNLSNKNYNRYSYSLLFDNGFTRQLAQKQIKYPRIDSI